MADLEHGVVKIGWTGGKHHYARTVALQSQYPFDLEPLVVFNGTLQDEAALLAFFEPHRTRPDRNGEWFFAADPLLAFIEFMGGGKFGKYANLTRVWKFRRRRNLVAAEQPEEDRATVARLD